MVLFTANGQIIQIYILQIKTTARIQKTYEWQKSKDYPEQIFVART
jgi:hypothetical protein